MIDPEGSTRASYELQIVARSLTIPGPAHELRQFAVFMLELVIAPDRHTVYLQPQVMTSLIALAAVEIETDLEA